MISRFQSALWLLAAAPAVDAAVIAKANNAIPLHIGPSWLGNVAPGANDVASFEANPTSQASRSAMTTDLSWGGIAVASNSPFGCRFGVAADTAFQLSLGASGINAQGTTTNNRAVVVEADLMLTADQTWTGASGASVLSLGSSRATGSYVDLGGRALTINGIAVNWSAPNTSSFAVKNGSVQVNSGASLTIDSGSRPTGTSPDPLCEVLGDVTIHVNAGGSLTPRQGTRHSENLLWSAKVILNGGRMDASGYTGFWAGAAEAYNNTVGGSIQVTAASSIELSSEITAPDPGGETLHKITAPISGSTTLSIRNASKMAAKNLIVLSGDNSGFTGAVGLVADATDGITSGRVRLASATSGTAGPWSVAAGNTLEIAAGSVTLGPLSGAGTVEATGGGAATLTINGAGNFTGTVTAATGSVLHFRKTGSGTHSQLGTVAWNGNTTVAGGKLAVSKATLADDSHVILESGGIIRLTHGSTDRVAKLFIDGVECAAGVWGKVGSGAAHESARIESDGFLQVGPLPPGAFETWINAHATALPEASDRDPAADPDRDGFDNFSEFAFAGDPAVATSRGFTHFESTTVPRFVVALRNGADFSGTGELVSAPVDGVVYRIQAATGLSGFTTEPVVESPGFTPPPGWPPLPDGWTYRCFETTRPVAETPQQFLRAVAVPET